MKRWRLVFLSLGKELRETIRDRRTLAIMILVPLVAYPLLALVGGQMMTQHKSGQAAKASIVAVTGDDPAAIELRARLDRQPALFARRPAGSATDVDQAKLDALVVIAAPTTSGPLARKHAEIVVDGTRDESQQAERRLTDELEAMWPKGCAPQFEINSRDVAPKARVGGYVLSKVLPLMILMMVLLGAFYPAIDLTAGERERGTLETVLVAPFRRSDLLLGKVLAVTILASASGLLNLGSMSITIMQVINLTAPDIVVPVPFARAAATGLVIVPMAFLLASVFVAVGSLARGFKEAQNLLMPVYFLMVLPAMLAMMGELPLTSRLALVPGLNVTLLARDIALGKAPAGMIALVLLATLIWAAVALLAATRFYVSERFLNVGDVERPKQGWAGRFGLRSTPGGGTPGGTPGVGRRQEGPTAAEAGVMFALGFLALEFIFFPLQRRDQISGLLISQWAGLLGGSVLFALLTRRQLPAAMGLQRPGGKILLAGTLMGLGGWVVANAISQWVLPPSQEYLEAFRKAIISNSRSVGLNLLLFAVTPALCEEVFFRGVIMRGLLTRMTPAGAIGLSAAMFSVFHIDLYRLLPTALLGLMLGFVAYRAGTFLASALVHFLNNGIVLVLSSLGLDKTIDAFGIPAQAALVVTATALVAGGAFLLLRMPRQLDPALDRTPRPRPALP